MTKKKNPQAEPPEACQDQSPDQVQEQTPCESENLQNQLGDLNDKYLRVLAEYDNYRKRSQKERESVYGDVQSATVAQLLPVLDNLDLALTQPCGDEEYKKGVELIVKQFREVLEKLGVQEIPAQDQPFDPLLHDAVLHIENEDLPENTVALVMRKGYTLGDRVIRHAMVQVAN